MSKIIDFYRGNDTDTEGRTIEQIWSFNSGQLEFCHDYIQWLFPLSEESNFNPDAPILTKEDQDIFVNDPLLQENMRLSFGVWLNFIGLTCENGQVVKNNNFNKKENLFVWENFNHNWLRITRVLKSLRECGLNNEAEMFFACLEKLREEGYGSENSFEYWREAMD